MDQLYLNQSKHGQKRIRERSCKSKRQNQLALERGMDKSEFSGSFRRYLDKLTYKESYYIKLKIYANDIFLYNTDGMLVTVLNIPSKYLKYLKNSNSKEE